MTLKLEKVIRALAIMLTIEPRMINKYYSMLSNLVYTHVFIVFILTFVPNHLPTE